MPTIEASSVSKNSQRRIANSSYTSPCHLVLSTPYCIVFKYLYSAPQQPWANRGAFG